MNGWIACPTVLSALTMRRCWISAGCLWKGEETAGWMSISDRESRPAIECITCTFGSNYSGSLTSIRQQSHIEWLTSNWQANNLQNSVLTRKACTNQTIKVLLPNSVTLPVEFGPVRWVGSSRPGVPMMVALRSLRHGLRLFKNN